MTLAPRTLDGRPRAPMRWERRLADFGGIARTRDLHALGLGDQEIRIHVGYGAIHRIRNGWYALPGVDERLIEAVRLGGRLACRSALAFHDGTAAPATVHIEVPANIPTPQTAKAAGARIHWTRRPSPGGIAIVDRDAAARQCEACGLPWTRAS